MSMPSIRSAVLMLACAGAATLVLAQTDPAALEPALSVLRERIVHALPEGPVQVRMTFGRSPPQFVSITAATATEVTVQSPFHRGGPVPWTRFAPDALAHGVERVIGPADVEARLALLTLWRALGDQARARTLLAELDGGDPETAARARQAWGGTPPSFLGSAASAPPTAGGNAPRAIDFRRRASWPDILAEGLVAGRGGQPVERKDSSTVCLGIAAAYPNDLGLAKDPATVVALDFDDGKIAYALADSWSGTDWKTVSSLSTDTPVTGRHSIMHEWKDGKTGGTASRWLLGNPDREECPAYFIRLYHRFDENWYGEGKVLGMKGFGFVGYARKVGNDTPCDGRNWYTAEMQWVGWGPSSKADAYRGLCIQGHLYSYLPAPELVRGALGDDIRITKPAAGNKPYRFSAYTQPFVYLQLGEWYCFEVGIYLNTPGKADGEARFWINGRLESRTTNMRYSDVKNAFKLYATINDYRTQNDGSRATVRRHIDNLVIARRYIGPIQFDQARLDWFVENGVVVHTGDDQLLQRMRAAARRAPPTPGATPGARPPPRSFHQ